MKSIVGRPATGELFCRAPLAKDPVVVVDVVVDL
jgi:hypothetical protein